VMLVVAAAAVAADTGLQPPSAPLAIPADLTTTAKPIWHAQTAGVKFVMARAEFTAAKPLKHAVAFVTAELSPFCTPDPRLIHNDYGACLPRGGTSQPKLLGAYKLFLNGFLVGVGPGRLVNATQGTDAIDITSAVAEGGNAVGLQGYHAGIHAGIHGSPRMLLQLVLTHVDGSSSTISTGPSWQTFDATPTFAPAGSSGAWAGGSGFPHEEIDMRLYPEGWAQHGFVAANLTAWTAAAVSPPFVLPLGVKSALSARPIRVLTRHARSTKAIAPPPPGPPPHPHPHPHPSPSPPSPPTSAPATCGIVDEGHTIEIACASKSEKISAIAFASFGTVTGKCGATGVGGGDTFKKGTCDAPSSVSVPSPFAHP